MSDQRPRVVIVRGHQANPWELAPWAQPVVGERYAVEFLRTRRGWFDTSTVALPSRPARALRDVLPPGTLGDLLVRVPGDRYLAPGRALEGAAIVHAQELGYWYSAQAARLKQRLGFKLVLTVWETLPFRATYRNARTRPYRERTLAAADLFLATTERARDALLLEGAAADRIRVSAPGIDTARFAAVAGEPRRRVVLSPGRLEWEKGHQDVLRANALLRIRGGAAADVAALIVGRGPEERRLRTYASDLGIEDAIEFRPFVPYDEMPHVYAGAACMVLASLPTMHWEEQFGMVLAEGHAAGLPVLASTSGAIPEVVSGGALPFAPGDWVGLADLIAGTLDGTAPPPGPMPGHTVEAAANRLVAAYDALLAEPRPR